MKGHGDAAALRVLSITDILLSQGGWSLQKNVRLNHVNMFSLKIKLFMSFWVPPFLLIQWTFYICAKVLVKNKKKWLQLCKIWTPKVKHIILGTVFLTPGLKLLLIGSQSKGYSKGEFPKEATYWGWFEPLRTFNIVCKTREQLAPSSILQKQKRKKGNIVFVERNEMRVWACLTWTCSQKQSQHRTGWATADVGPSDNPGSRYWRVRTGYLWDCCF